MEVDTPTSEASYGVKVRTGISQGTGPEWAGELLRLDKVVACSSSQNSIILRDVNTLSDSGCLKVYLSYYL